MRNPTLYEVLREYCEAALLVLGRRVTEGEAAFRIRERFEFGESGGLRRSYMTEVDWFSLVYRSEGILSQLGEHGAAIAALQEDERVAHYLATSGGTDWFPRLDAHGMLQSVLGRLLQQQGDSAFQEDVFNTIYKGVEDYFYSDKLMVRYLAPLGGFAMKRERIALRPDLSLIRVTDDERLEVLSASRSAPPAAFSSSHQAMGLREYALELYVDMPKHIGRTSESSWVAPDQVATEAFDDACWALRLFKAGAVGYDHIRGQFAGWHPVGGTWTTGPLAPGHFFAGSYVLSEEEVAEFSEFWKCWQRTSGAKQRTVEVALRTFNFAYKRVMPEDKLIDCMIGLEALLIKRSEVHELPYRLALRGAALLAKDATDREKIREHLTTAYRQRSNIVHGGASKDTIKMAGETVSFSDFVNRVEDYLRSAIRDFVLRCENQRDLQVIDELEKQIACGFPMEGCGTSPVLVR